MCTPGIFPVFSFAMNFLKTERFREYIKIIQEAYFMIEVKNLVKDYGKHHAVKDISFSVPDGQIVGLLGPNGAGKSTTMNIMTGYISATSGEVKIGGYDILEQPIQAKKLIGYLPEIPPLYEDMTVAEYLNFICDLKGIRKKTEKESSINEVTEAVKISDMKGRLIKNLSKGYKQRVGLAQALIGNPPLLILDEPTVGLDPSQIMEIRSLIRDLGKEHTIILSSHILQEIQAVCNRIIIIGEGRLLVDQKEAELLGNPIDGGFQEGGRMQNYRIRIQGAAEKIAPGLGALPGVSRVSFENHVSENEYTFTVQANGAGFREEVFDFCVRNGWKLLGLEGRERTLEDIFLQVTQK